MKKLYKILTMFLVTNILVLNVVACDNDSEKRKQIIVDSWVKKMIKKSPKTVNIGYDHYFLVNKTNSEDGYNQHDWIDLDTNPALYIYLPETNNIKDATTLLTLKDSAKTVNMPNPITWKKIDDHTYTNNNFITEDTSVGNNSLMDNEKFNQILNSTKSNTWTTEQTNSFKNYGSMPVRVTDQNWWNANGWEKLLVTTNDFHNNNKSYSQLDIYQNWISQKAIGMNVPLSLIDENSFTLQTTNLNHVFCLITTLKEIWINNNGQLQSLPCPHWGITLQILKFETPQFIHLSNSWHVQETIDYLKEQNYNSFNSEETTIFKKNFIS